ncbi:MAG: site-specific integrase [Acidobacteria bacterium]|nr:site-specific integrase [Acidobacteriota bacterium]
MTVFKRNGHWWFTKTINRKQIRKPLPTARTKAQAEEAERKELEKLHNQKYGKAQSATPMIDYAEKVYLPWARKNKRSTNDPYYLKAIKDFFKRKTFEEISPLLVEKFKSEIKNGMTKFDQQRKPASVNREMTCLSRIFNMAIRDGVTSSTPCDQVKLLREDNQRTRYLSAEEEARLLRQCIGEREHLRPIILLAINTGMRRGEILALRWSQIDFLRNLIHLSNTKSGKGRDVPINSTVREVLLKLDQSKEFVFVSPKTGLALVEIKHAFARACEEAEVSDFHFHDLRHTAATRMADAGVDAFTIAAILGHADLRMTARYTHTLESRKREALEKIADLGKSGHKSVTMKKRESIKLPLSG